MDNPVAIVPLFGYENCNLNELKPLVKSPDIFPKLQECVWKIPHYKADLMV
jgi:hypothetical protein